MTGRFRTLLLNGSPRERGHSVRLAEIVLGGLPSDTDIVHLYRKNIAPCRACLACVEGGDCPIRDDMPALVRSLMEADLVFLASPLHFTSLTAPVIAFFSRLQPFWQAQRKGRPPPFPPRAKIAALAVTGGGRYPEMFRPARSVALAAFNSLGLDSAGMATAGGTDTLPLPENADAVAEAAALADAIEKRLAPA